MFTWETGDYWVTRLVFQRALGIAYLVAFLCALNQFVSLLGEHGLLPVPSFLRQLSFRDSPILFFLAPKDWAFTTASWVGIVLSCLAIVGFADRFSWWVNALVSAGIWVSNLLRQRRPGILPIRVGGILLEAGFFAIFLGARASATPVIVIYLLRWLEFGDVRRGVDQASGRCVLAELDLPRLSL